MEDSAHQFRRDVSKDPRDDDHGDGYGGNAAQFFGDAQADSGGDGFGKQRNVLFVGQAKQF